MQDIIDEFPSITLDMEEPLLIRSPTLIISFDHPLKHFARLVSNCFSSCVSIQDVEKVILAIDKLFYDTTNTQMTSMGAMCALQAMKILYNYQHATRGTLDEMTRTQAKSYFVTACLASAKYQADYHANVKVISDGLGIKDYLKIEQHILRLVEYKLYVKPEDYSLLRYCFGLPRHV